MLGRRTQPYQVSLDADGFAVTEGAKVICRLLWNDVCKAVAYKADLFTTDRVYVELWPAVGAAVVVHEDAPGFAAFRDEMERALPGIDADWWEQVVQPPFATNETVIFRRTPT